MSCSVGCLPPPRHAKKLLFLLKLTFQCPRRFACARSLTRHAALYFYVSNNMRYVKLLIYCASVYLISWITLFALEDVKNPETIKYKTINKTGMVIIKERIICPSLRFPCLWSQEVIATPLCFIFYPINYLWIVASR